MTQQLQRSFFPAQKYPLWFGPDELRMMGVFPAIRDIAAQLHQSSFVVEDFWWFRLSWVAPSLRCKSCLKVDNFFFLHLFVLKVCQWWQGDFLSGNRTHFAKMTQAVGKSWNIHDWILLVLPFSTPVGLKGLHQTTSATKWAIGFSLLGTMKVTGSNWRRKTYLAITKNCFSILAVVEQIVQFAWIANGATWVINRVSWTSAATIQLHQQESLWVWS